MNYPELPKLPPAGLGEYSDGEKLFSGRQMEAYALAYGSAIKEWAASQVGDCAQAGDTMPALRRLFPLVEKALGGFVFTADKAGEVAADMAVLRAAAIREVKNDVP